MSSINENKGDRVGGGSEGKELVGEVEGRKFSRREDKNFTKSHTNAHCCYCKQFITYPGVPIRRLLDL